MMFAAFYRYSKKKSETEFCFDFNKELLFWFLFGSETKTKKEIKMNIFFQIFCF